MELDAINDRILRELERDGRISNLHLAEKVGLSPSACLRRVQELERRGVISGYRAVIDRSRLGVGLVVVMAIRLRVQTRDSQRGFERAVEQIPQVRECHNVTGDIEYLLRVEARDLAEFKHIHTEQLSALPNVSQMVSYIVMSSPKDMRA